MSQSHAPATESLASTDDWPHREPTERRSLKWLLACVVPLLAIYLLMLNPYWVPSGDGEVYTAIARSLARGEGLEFNGARAAIAPPGWPMVLAGAMLISPEFWFLKLVTIGCMTGSLAIGFFLLRRFVDDRLAAACVLMAGLLQPVFQLTYFMHTEGFFCLTASGALLCAFRIGERRAKGYEVVLMLVLIGLASFSRWPGFLHLLLLTPAMLQGSWRRWSKQAVVATLLAWVVAVGTFKVTLDYLSLDDKEARAARVAGGGPDNDDEAEPEVVATTQPVTDDQKTPTVLSTSHNTKAGLVEEYAGRIGNAGKWFAWLLWQPTRFGVSVPPINISGLVVGWTVILLLVATMVDAIRRGQWFWIGMALYTGGLVVIWPLPNSRYYVPIAIFIIAGVMIGLRLLAAARPKPARVLRVAFVVAILATNVPLLLIDIYIFRSGDRFYRLYEAGSNAELIEIAHYVRERPPTFGTIALTERYANMGRIRYSKFGVRAMHVLTDTNILAVDRTGRLSRRPTEEPARRWANRHDVEYFIYQVPMEPWRVWHFRLTPELQEMLTGKPSTGETGGWELYFREPGSVRYKRVTDLPKLQDPWPTRVPGM